MLVLSRKANSKTVIRENVELVVIAVNIDHANLGFKVPIRRIKNQHRIRSNPSKPSACPRF